MKNHDAMIAISEVLEAQVQILEAKLAIEMLVKKELRSQQVAILKQENDVMESLQETSVSQPELFRFAELRLRKLVDDQNKLQPGLVKAAISRVRVQSELKEVLRKKLSFALFVQRQKEKPPHSATAAQQSLLLFEMKKRR
jgi:hypothetical protein